MTDYAQIMIIGLYVVSMIAGIEIGRGFSFWKW